jgi:two-component system, OmpR family, phosphate regulon sensor histidine kinase PhoR
VRPKTKNQIEVIAAIIAITLFVVVIFTGVYLVTAAIYARMDQPPSGVVTQAINTLLSLFCIFVVLIGLSHFFGSSQRSLETGVFGSIFEAMEKIAKGDFSVTINSENIQESGIIGELAKSVNTMALELNEMEQMRQEFISDVSHEIQSPLTSIRGFAKALQSDDLSAADRQHYLDIIESESSRLSKLTENLLKLASLESKQVKFEPKPYRLDRQIRSLILACEPQWTDKSIEMDVSLEEIEAIADEDLLSQVWMNLISNSIKFTPGRGHIYVELCRQAGGIEFKISDNGIGIPEVDQARIFERFYKADKSRTHSTNSGSGLGLSIAQKIVEIHQGKIAVESKVGIGTTFTVSLPTS